MPSADAPQTPHDELRSQIVDLMLEIMRRDASEAPPVDDTTPCIGGELLVDSLDVLEFVVGIDRVYGVSIRDSDVGREALSDLGTLARFVAEHRTR